MFPLLEKKELTPTIVQIKIQAPNIAKKALPGQFIIFRISEEGERVPLTISDFDRQAGSITLIFQKAGLSTTLLGELEPGDSLLDVVGPLGRPTELDGYQRVAVIGGGVGCAIAYPQAKALFEKSASVDVIAGFRDSSMVILEKEMRAVSHHLILTTDDGSYGTKGFVTDALKKQIEAGRQYDAVIAIGPIPMMKMVCAVTKPFEIKTIVSLNPIMIDGTGMCGGCRVTVGGQIKFACVDGPDFDGHQVDFDELSIRNRIFQQTEGKKNSSHVCHLQTLADQQTEGRQ